MAVLRWQKDRAKSTQNQIKLYIGINVNQTKIHKTYYEVLHIYSQYKDPKSIENKALSFCLQHQGCAAESKFTVGTDCEIL